MSTSLNPHDAQQLLDRADKLRYSVAGFSLSWIGFVGICAGSALYAIGAPIWTTTDFPHAILLTTALAWILSFAVFSIVVAIRAGSAPRGFAIRWGLMMAAWALLWVVTTFLGPEFTAWQAAGTAGGFLLLALIGTAWELISTPRSARSAQ